MKPLFLLLALLLVSKSLAFTAGDLMPFEIRLSPLAVQSTDLFGRDAQMGDDLEQVSTFVEGKEGQSGDFAFVLLADGFSALTGAEACSEA